MQKLPFELLTLLTPLMVQTGVTLRHAPYIEGRTNLPGGERGEVPKPD